MRCSAASTSPMAARRPSSERRRVRSLRVERFEPRLRRRDLGLDGAQARGGVDQALVELAAVAADLLDLALDRGFGFGGFALRAAQRFEFFVALLEQVELAGRLVLRLLRGRARRRVERERQSKAEPCDQREARIKTVISPESNHAVQVTPAGRHHKAPLIKRSLRR